MLHVFPLESRLSCILLEMFPPWSTHRMLEMFPECDHNSIIIQCPSRQETQLLNERQDRQLYNTTVHSHYQHNAFMFHVLLINVQYSLYSTVLCSLYSNVYYTVMCFIHYTVMCCIHYTLDNCVHFTVMYRTHYGIICSIHYTVMCSIHYTVEYCVHYRVMHSIHYTVGVVFTIQ